MGIRRPRRLPSLAARPVILAHMHEPVCKCSRCRVARNYARLRAASADGPVAEPAQPLATEFRIPREDAKWLDRDAVALDAHA